MTACVMLLILIMAERWSLVTAQKFAVLPPAANGSAGHVDAERRHVTAP
jgi:hypothetical protein